MFDDRRAVRIGLGARLIGAAILASAGCSSDISKPETENVGTTRIRFEEFEASVYREPGDGAYVVEGDIRIQGRDALKAYFEKYVQAGALIVYTDHREDVRWNDVHKRAISYCVSTSFGANYNAVVAAMSNAAAAWSSVAPVGFRHVSSQDDACSNANGLVTFDVNPTTGQPYFATGFFPQPLTVRAGHNVLIDSKSFGNIAPLTLTGVLRHVLGHTLGFFHEYHRPEAPLPGCASYKVPDGWRPLTPYDPASVMSFLEFPDCVNQRDPVLSQRDAEGAAALYGRAPVSTNASQDGRIAAVSRKQNLLNVFWISADGAVKHTSWTQDIGIRSEELAPAGSAAPRGHIAAVSRTPTSIELWYIGADGSVRDMYWYEGGSWGGFPIAPAGSAATDGGIAAVSRDSTSMELWYIGADGSIQDKYWYEGGNWDGFALAPAGAASIHGSIAAVSRAPTSMELWYIGADGSIQDKNWYEGGNWGGLALTAPNAASLNGSIAAVSRVPTSMELWYIGADGSIQDKNWYEGGNWGGLALTAPNAASLNGSIAAVSRVRTSMELWYIGADGSIQDLNWYEGGKWGGFALARPHTASLNGSIAATWRMPASMEFWFTGANGSIQDKLWYEGNPWGGFETAPPGSTAQ